ncbi:MAG: sugar transferase, partial [Lachnobacterium sp.]|nr:sugar transferase [Lachnobacterium sp.]
MGITTHVAIARTRSQEDPKQFVERIGGVVYMTKTMNYASARQLFLKRAIDIAGGLVGCLLMVLIMIVVGPIIYLSSPGPIFFAQERIGRNGRKFKMYKFRSMYMDAEERKKELMSQNKIGDGMMFKMDFDPRIIGNKILPDGTKKTGIGQFIRRTSLDE